MTKQGFFHEKTTVAAGVILQFPKDLIAERLIEIACLEFISIEPSAVATAKARLALGHSQDFCADTKASQLHWQEKKLDREPAIAGSAPKTAKQLLLAINPHDEQSTFARTGSVGIIESQSLRKLAPERLVGAIRNCQRVIQHRAGIGTES